MPFRLFRDDDSTFLQVRRAAVNKLISLWLYSLWWTRRVLKIFTTCTINRAKYRLIKSGINFSFTISTISPSRHHKSLYYQYNLKRVVINEIVSFLIDTQQKTFYSFIKFNLNFLFRSTVVGRARLTLSDARKIDCRPFSMSWHGLLRFDWSGRWYCCGGLQ